MASIADVLIKGRIYRRVACVCLSILMLSNVYAGDEVQPARQASSGQALYASVGDREITVEQFNQAYSRAVRQRFYHGRPPEAELAAVRKEIADELIARELLLIEAERAGHPAAAGIDLLHSGSGDQSQQLQYSSCAEIGFLLTVAM